MDKRIKDLTVATSVALNYLIAVDAEGLVESKRISLDQLKMILGIIATSGIEGVVPSESFVPPPPPGGSTVVYFAKPGTYPGFTGLDPLTDPLNLITWNGTSAQGLGIDIGVDLSDYVSNEQKNAPNGVAALDENAELPDYAKKAELPTIELSSGGADWFELPDTATFIDKGISASSDLIDAAFNLSDYYNVDG
ncbi:MAG: hypothetical protein QHC79_09500, partial [Pseudosphingobacterium sp.]|nr:hypothetical protein [Pseudosphingobacterium sp.]